MIGQEIFGYFLKWLIPFLCAGVFALVVKPILRDWNLGKKLQTQSEWNENAKSLKDDIEGFKVASQANDLFLQEELGRIKSELSAEIATNTAGVREALLDSHLKNLIYMSKHYLSENWISVDNWEDYQVAYQTYIKLGGNGHMDPWYSKVKRLSNQPHKED